MVKKRELVVEKWARTLKVELERLTNADDELATSWVRHHVDAGHDLKDVFFEQQMAAIWRNTGMQVYDFDPDFTSSILGEKWIDLLPDCIEHRPLNCFYMKLPCDGMSEGAVVLVIPTDRIDGFQPDWFPGAFDGKGVYVGGNPDNGELRTLVNTGEEVFCLSYFAIPKRIELMYDDTPLERYPTQLVANGVAYLCSKNADIVPSYKPQPNLPRNNAKRRSNATWHDVGYHVGAQLRAYEHSRRSQANGGHGSVRPHMRRAHWHHFWTGPRDGERELVLKWLSPTMVNAGKTESATLHKVG